MYKIADWHKYNQRFVIFIVVFNLSVQETQNVKQITRQSRNKPNPPP